MSAVSKSDKTLPGKLWICPTDRRSDHFLGAENSDKKTKDFTNTVMKNKTSIV